MGPPQVVFPLFLLLISFLSFLSLATSESIHTSLQQTLSTCSVTPLLLNDINPVVTASSSNITYYSITMPPTAPAGFKLKINQPYGSSRNCEFEVFVGDDNNVCPDPKNNIKSAHGFSTDFPQLNQTSNTYYFGVRSVNCSTQQLVFQIFATCPSYCIGPGAHCSLSTGCFCANNYYDALSGCFVTGPCDPTAKYEYTCAIPFGYGNQTCNVDQRTNTTFLGMCRVAGCKPGFIIDWHGNCCKRVTPPPPPGPQQPAATTEPWWRVGSLGTAASITIWCAFSFAVLVVLSVAIVFVVRKRTSIMTNDLSYSEFDDRL